MMPAIDADGIAGDVTASIRHQENHQIAQLIHLAEPAQRNLVRLRRAHAGLHQRIELVPGIFGREWTGRHRVDANALRSPFDGERHRHRMNRSFGHRGRHHIGRSGPDPSHEIAYDHAGNPRGNPTSAATLRRVERAVHDG
jgi:hypothetical protein